MAVTLADGGDCLSDLDALREQETLLGKVASDSTAYRMITATSQRLADLRAARAKARARIWDQGARPDRIVLDIDATLVTSHSDKEQAKGNWKGGYGFHPSLCYLDVGSRALKRFVLVLVVGKIEVVADSVANGHDLKQCAILI